ncbi:hypothetical protein SAMN05660826_00142 [Caldanaerovirga acetigignens]|uniref:Uncharacterized protein n=1 Tax=Caldanaerovirga acetigignens TaxID=447595 RepID=A0A1M7FSR8_9FIRM|nr:hypothetical protein [Caldanaerovirga acetigignens]SHM07131.1 hypothetical protein SAMN05660826_00142 [Caldanaerovirga acetigignens]
METTKKVFIVILTVVFLFCSYYFLGSRAIVAYNMKNLVYINNVEPLKFVMEKERIKKMVMEVN